MARIQTEAQGYLAEWEKAEDILETDPFQTGIESLLEPLSQSLSSHRDANPGIKRSQFKY